MRKKYNLRLKPLNSSRNPQESIKENIIPSNAILKNYKVQSYTKPSSKILLQLPNLCIPPLHPFMSYKKVIVKTHRRFISSEPNHPKLQEKVAFIDLFPVDNEKNQKRPKSKRSSTSNGLTNTSKYSQRTRDSSSCKDSLFNIENIKLIDMHKEVNNEDIVYDAKHLENTLKSTFNLENESSDYESPGRFTNQFLKPKLNL